MTDLQIKQLVDLMYANETKGINNIYHYTTDEITNLILREDCVCLKMTNIDKFDDKYEGKTVEIYYDLAIEKLLKDSKISESTYDTLTKIRVPQKNGYIFENGTGIQTLRLIESDVYITCFSKEKDSQYMVQEYIKNENNSGYCLDFSFVNLKSNEITRNLGFGFQLKLIPVKYGVQIIEELYNFVDNVLSIPDTLDENYIFQYAKGVIQSKLDQMKYATKLSKFYLENEIRMVLIVPKGYLPYEEIKQYFESIDGGCIIKLPHYVFFSMNKSPNLSDEKDRKWRECFRQRGYRFLY